VPRLMVLGLLYTCSNAAERAKKFYELIQIDLNDQIYLGDKEFQEYFPLLAQFSFNFVIKHYNRCVVFLNENNHILAEEYP